MWGSGSRRVGSKISVIFQLRSVKCQTQVLRRSVVESASLELVSVIIRSCLQFLFSPRFHSWILSCQSQGSPAFFSFNPFLFSSLVIKNGPQVHWHCGFPQGGRPTLLDFGTSQSKGRQPRSELPFPPQATLVTAWRWVEVKIAASREPHTRPASSLEVHYLRLMCHKMKTIIREKYKYLGC